MSKYILLSILSIIGMSLAFNACATVCLESDTDSSETSNTSDDAPVATSNPVNEPECSKYVNVSKCPITYPDCGDEFKTVRFMTHGSHDCDTMPYPPKFCEYVGDVACEGQIAGVWCCR